MTEAVRKKTNFSVDRTAKILYDYLQSYKSPIEK